MSNNEKQALKSHLLSIMKRFVASANQAFKMEELKKHVAEAIAQVGPQKWKNYVKHVVEEEEKMKQMDHINRACC